MHFLKYLPLFILPSVLANPHPKADAAVVTKDIGTISQAVASLNNSVVAYQGDIHDALTIQHKSDDVSKAVTQTTNVAKSADPFNNDESATVGVAVLNLKPDIENLLDNLQAKKETFGGLASIVRNTLKKQRQQTIDLGDAITAKLTPDFAAVAPQIINEIVVKFDETIAVYEKK